MIKVKISNFIKNNINKIKNLGTKLIIVAIVVFIATIILSLNRGSDENVNNQEKEVYDPTETVIKGSNVSVEQYKSDTNIVEMFLNYCNKKDISSAYKMLSDDCKKEVYQTQELFETIYCDSIFSTEREYNLQSWISTSEYTIYKIRYTNNMITTGKYDENDVFQDYITLSKGLNNKKISIGNFIISEDCNISTKTNEIEATVVKKKKYISEEEYEIKIRNNTSNIILMDDLQNRDTINLVGSSGATYSAYVNNLFFIDLMINPGETKTIKIKFKKNCSSGNKSEKIEFVKIIKDYNEYIKNKEDYNDICSVKIKLEG